MAVRNAVHNAFVNTLTVGKPIPRVPAAFQQWKLRYHEFPVEMTPAVLIKSNLLVQKVRDGH